MSFTRMNAKIFSGKTAWFSQTVPSELKKEWFNHGGRVETIDEADFIFSAEYDGDIVHYFNGKSGFRNKYPVTLFHPDFIRECVIRKSFKSVPIGSFALLPQFLMHMNGRCHN